MEELQNQRVEEKETEVVNDDLDGEYELRELLKALNSEEQGNNTSFLRLITPIIFAIFETDYYNYIDDFGNGFGNGLGYGYDSGNGYGNGFGFGFGFCYGFNNGNGFGRGYHHGVGYGNGFGYDNGYDRGLVS